LVIQGGTNSIGYETADSADPLRELRQSDAKLRSTGDMAILLRNDPTLAAPLDADGNAINFGGPYSLVIRGGVANAMPDAAPPVRTVTALGALQAKKLNLTADGSILLQGGSSTVNSSNVLAETSAIVLVETQKDITTTNTASVADPAFGSLVIRGGRATNSTVGPLNGNNARARALLDPSKLTVDVAGGLVLEGGIGPSRTFTTASARIDAADEVRLTVRGSGIRYTYTAGSGAATTLTGAFFMIGGDSSGFYDSANSPLGAGTAPLVFPITITAPGGFVKALDPSRSDAVVQTGLTTFSESLLSYIIFAANEETRSARIRRGLTDTDDLGAPACK
jgi:hypothetical protein